MPLNTTLIKAIPWSVPANYCFTTVQQLVIDLINGSLFVFQSSIGNTFFNQGDSTPTPDNQIYPWLRTIGGLPDDWYIFYGGSWIAEYRRAPPGPNGLRWWYEDTEASLKTFDGGEDTTPITATRGPFWEVDHNYDGRLAMGAGVIPNANPAKTLSVGETYGEGSHLQTATEVAAHTHDAPITNGFYAVFKSDYTQDNLGNEGLTDQANQQLVGSRSVTGAITGATSQERMPVLPPLRGGFWIKRSVRKFKRVDP